MVRASTCHVLQFIGIVAVVQVVMYIVTHCESGHKDAVPSASRSKHRSHHSPTKPKPTLPPARTPPPRPPGARPRPTLPPDADLTALPVPVFHNHSFTSLPYSAILTHVYEPLGYSVNPDLVKDQQYPFLPLLRPKHDCQQVFKDWLAKNDGEANLNPPRFEELTDSDQKAFALNGYGGVASMYFHSDAKNMDQHHTLYLTKKDLARLTARIALKRYSDLGYDYEGAAVYHSMAAHPPGKRGMTVGSISLWVESIALYLGATDVTIAEYQPLQSFVPQISYVHPKTVAAEMDKYLGLDFLASFSSMEHSGLGRFGDFIDPVGDLRESEKAHCLLKPGGLFFLGLPTGGTDSVVFNAHRIYSYVRWPLMAAGFKAVAFFQNDGPDPVDFHYVVSHPSLQSSKEAFHQIIAVLQKL